MNRSRIELKLEHILWGLILLLAFFLRLSTLEAASFGDAEAEAALGALLASGSPSPFSTALMPGVHPLFQNMAGWLFTLFGSSDAIARIPSALAGFALVLTPLLLRKRFGGGLAIGIGFCFALSPVMLSSARIAGGSSLALLGFTLALFAWAGSPLQVTRERTVLAGAGLGLAIASGPSSYSGMLALVLTLIVLRRRLPGAGPSRTDLRWFMGSVILVAVLLATGLGADWNGLAGIGGGFAAWLQGWSVPGSTGAGTFLAMLVSFEPLVLAFALIGILLALTGRLSTFDRSFALFAGMALLISLLRVGREPQDLVWVLLPTIWLAGRTLVIVVERLGEITDWLQIATLSGALLILAASAGVSMMSFLGGYQLSRLGSSPSLLYFIFGALLLMGASLIFIFGMEWSWRVVLDSAAFTIFAITLSLSLQAGWRLNFGPPASGARQAWAPEHATGQIALLEETLLQASLKQTGMPWSLAIQVNSDLPPSLAWYLRGYRRASGEFVPGQTPPVAMLTPGTQGEVRLLAEYYGQDFALRTIPQAGGSLPAQVIRWWVLDEGSETLEPWTLWIRADVAGLGESPGGISP